MNRTDGEVLQMDRLPQNKSPATRATPHEVIEAPRANNIAQNAVSLARRPAYLVGT